MIPDGVGLVLLLRVSRAALVESRFPCDTLLLILTG